MEVGACNYNPQANFNLGCYYAAFGYLCDGGCESDLDIDGVCDVVDNFICLNDIDNDQVCDDIDQCTDVNACNYNQHWLDVLYNLPYDCRYDTDNDGICPVNPDHIQYLNYNIFGNSNYWEVYITQSGNQYQTMQYNYNDFDFCEDQNACNVSSNGYLYGTLLNTEWFMIDAGLLGSYNFDHWEYSYMSTSTPNSDYTFTSSPSYGCAYDNDNDGICDIIDHCHDINACNYMNTNNEECFPDTDNDGICDNLDGCFSTNFCSYNNPTATSCQNSGSQCNTTAPNATYAIYDENCICQQYFAGCTDPNSCNFDPNAWPDDGSCSYVGGSCDDGNTNTILDVYDANCICVPFLPGCIDASACNYSVYAGYNDGSCSYIGGSCDDANSNTILDVYDANCQCQGIALLYTQGNGVTDIDGNFYPSIIINGQEWMQENLKVGHYRNGDPITTGLDDAAWEITTNGAYGINENNMANNTIYGKLYNWYAVNDSRNLCPAGWHVPSDAEWTTMINYLDPNAAGGETQPNVAGGKMKSTGTLDNGDGLWYGPDLQEANESGFTGLPSGYCWDVGGYLAVSIEGFWWSRSENDFSSSWSRGLFYNSSSVLRSFSNKHYGFSIRCLRD